MRLFAKFTLEAIRAEDGMHINTCIVTIAHFVSNQAVNESCYRGDDSVLKSLVEIADTAPKYLRPNLEATLQLSLKVSQHINLLYFISSIG